MTKTIFCLIIMAFPLTQAYAAVYVCPQTYKTIMTGDSSQQVEAACGKPESVNDKTSIQTRPVTFKQWVYTTGNMSTANQFAPKMLITFDNGNVSEISTSNQGAATNFPCYSKGLIKVGATSSQVQIQCGVPAYVNTIQKGFSQPVKETVLTYNFGSYRPKMIFTFENNKLIKIETGQLAK